MVGMTIAHALHGAPPGVAGVHLTLDSLSALLRDQPLPPDALIMLFHENGEVIAHSGDSPATREGGGPLGDSPRLARVDELDDPRATALFQEYRHAHGAVDGHKVAVDDRQFLAWSTPLHQEHWSDTHLGILAPEDLFVGPHRAIGRRSLLISLALLALALPIGVLAARAIGRPLRALSAEAEQIRQFRLDQPVAVSSHITEVETLARSMDAMKGGLRTFGLYVPTGLVRQIIEAGGQSRLGGQRRDLTLLFTDIESFTAFAEHEPPEVVMGRLSQYLEALTTALLMHHGTIDKFIGDSIMAFWNAPVLDSDHVVHACAGALAAIAANKDLNRTWAASDRPPFRTRVGLHVGEAIVGNVGSADRMNYTAIGSAVNLASRLEGLNNAYGTSILASAAVVERAGHRFAFRAAGLVRPKNILEPLAVYELVGERDAVDPAGLAAWDAARRAFLAGRFDEAAERFAALALACPEDGLAKTYRARAMAFHARPPAQGWDGVEGPAEN
jgi:adenylate cyclase